jgi:tetratricopeptide (TPR) repeat protein
MVKEALMAAEKGLEIDPLNVGCINLRALALGRLGRTKEARATSLNSLARDPVNAISHAIQGTTLLRQAEYGLAMASFLEGLRLDPLCEWAHRGRRKARLGFGLVWPAWAIGHSLLRLAGAHRAHFKEPTIRRAGWLGSLVLLAAGALVGGAALGEPLVSAFLLAYCLALVGLSWVFHLIPGAVGHLGQLLCLILSLCILLFPFLLIIYINFNLSVSMIRIFAYLEAAIVTASFVALNQFLIGLAWADELAEASLPRRRKK